MVGGVDAFWKNKNSKKSFDKLRLAAYKARRCGGAATEIFARMAELVDALG